MPGSFLLLGDNGRCEAKLPVKSKEPYKYIEKVKLGRKEEIREATKDTFYATLRTPSSTTNLPADRVAPPAKKLEC